jgi:hypothetical protein
MSIYRPDDPAGGEVIGQRYALLRRLREEPWGEVWLAQDQVLDAEVGLKLIRREAPEWDAAQKLFAQEAALALKLRHPQILGVFYLGQTAEVLYLVQEPFLGESLLVQLTRKHRFSLPQALQLLEQTGRALVLAHQRGVAHRSLSPLHLLVKEEEVRLANFAFPPAEGDQVLYLELKAYDAPEVIHGEAPTAASNVFSLGVLGFRLMAGSLPYPLTFDEPFPYRLETLPVDLEEIPLPLQNFLLQCLAVDPEERFPDAEAFLKQLRQVREQLGPGRRGAWASWQEERPRRVRQAAAQAGALLGKLREAGKPLGKKVGEGAQASWQTLKAVPRRLWWGLGLAVLLALIILGLQTGRRAAETSAVSAPAAAPVKLSPVGGGPPLRESGEGAAPQPAAPAAKPAEPGQPATAIATPPEAKAAAQERERYLLVVASYVHQKQAQALLKSLKAHNHRARIVRRTTRGKTLYQVQIGPVTGAKAAEDLARTLKEQEKVTPKIMKIADKNPKKTSKKTPKKTNSAASRRPAR